ncbi:uncharacterized protein N7525_006411 [Penicillium rubens]|uniref:uncharacterized protein n=1 Tax=Penicillium rubens TaxID=1108849 RepID=UPI002A59E395|nr:uncharacterized protein N7525_006411 [Penicillium rubens]KAJ5828158.1 hypothetical protein N7525_006411 [Penicillium rubens]KAJ5842091.1 hypothetical protein N7534_011921 [Penicillium rubens]
MTDLRRSAIFCATDGDLAVLLFYGLSCQIERRMADQPALQLSSLALTSYGGSSAGFQGKVGLKANIEDVRAHPHPTMVVEAYKLAANAFAEEIQNSLPVADTKRISDLNCGASKLPLSCTYLLFAAMGTLRPSEPCQQLEIPVIMARLVDVHNRFQKMATAVAGSPHHFNLKFLEPFRKM